MKRIFKLMAALVAATIAYSCVEEVNPQTDNSGEGTSIYDENMRTIEFAVGDLKTRTSYDKTNGHQWSEGDRIRIIWGERIEKSVTAEIGTDGKVTAIVGDVDTYYAVYPHNAEYDLTAGQLSVTIPRNQDGSFEQANIMAATTSKEDALFKFKNLTHIIKFTLNEGHGYDKIEFCPNSEVRITGKYSVNLENAELTYKENNSKYTTVSTVSGKSGDFYIGIEPGTNMSTGIAIHASKNEENDYRYFALSKNGITTNRSAITPLGPIDTYLRENKWFITEDGTGDGSSWDKPADIKKLIELMNKIQLNDSTLTKTIHQWRLNKAEIHVAAGEYDIQAANGGLNFLPSGLTEKCNVRIIGGYPTVPTDEDKPLIGDEGSATVFTTGNSEENSRIFSFKGKEFGSLTFEGISFKKNGANAVGLVDFRENTKGNITFNNCYISVQTTNANPGIIRIVSSTTGLVANFHNCRFVNNSGEALKSGAIYADGDVTVNIDKCIFDGNSAINCADIEYNNNAKIFINRTCFKNGKTSLKSTTKWHGSSISSTTPGDNSQLCMNNCIIYNYTNAGSTRIQPVIFNQKRHHLINSTICSNCTQVIRLTGGSKTKDLNINNVVVNTNAAGNGSIVQSGTGNESDYNILQLATVGQNTEARKNETVLSSPADITLNWNNAGNLLTWSLNNGVTVKANITKENIESITATNYPEFDKWLRSVETDPYGIDFYGNRRNAGKLNPGAWDEGL